MEARETTLFGVAKNSMQQMVAGACCAGPDAPLRSSPFGQAPVESIGREPEGRLLGGCSQQLPRGEWGLVGCGGEEGERYGDETTRDRDRGGYFLHCLTKYGQGGGETRHRSSPGQERKKKWEASFKCFCFPPK